VGVTEGCEVQAGAGLHSFAISSRVWLTDRSHIAGNPVIEAVYLEDRASSRSRVVAMLSMKTLPQSSSVRASSGAREQS
jgi:hypothetical protein